MNKQQKLLTFNLFLLTFVLGTSEFVMVGLLTEVAEDMKIAISAAGSLVSAFALSFAIGTPIFTALFSRLLQAPAHPCFDRRIYIREHDNGYIGIVRIASGVQSDHGRGYGRLDWTRDGGGQRNDASRKKRAL